MKEEVKIVLLSLFIRFMTRSYFSFFYLNFPICPNLGQEHLFTKIQAGQGDLITEDTYISQGYI